MSVDPAALQRVPSKSLESIASDELPAEGGAAEVEIKKLTVGGNVVVGLLLLVFAVLILVALYAAFTKPEIQDAKDLAPQNVSATYKEQRTAWFTEIKDLLQILVVSLLVPLLATLVGYLFGRQQTAPSD
jgi:hypothetical protein